jgi:acetylornithine deacetylase/succinyl-diaminopimelate desuccinylase-like protein
MRSRFCVAVFLAVFAAPLYVSAEGEDAVSVPPQIQAGALALLQDTSVRAAFDYVESADSELLGDLIELTEIPAPPYGESARAERFAQYLRDAGLVDVHIDEVGNAIGLRPGRRDDRTIAVIAHLDTVFPEGTDVTVRAEGNTYFAPGIGDNTRGLVMALAILRAMQVANIETDADVLFVGNVGEEGLGDLRGVKHLFREGGRTIDAMIAIDGGETNRLIWGGVGSHRYRVTYNGPGGHSWGAFGTANPQHALGRAIALFDEQAVAVTRHGEKTTYNVGRIGGGTSINSIPSDAWAEIDLRSGSQEKLDEIDAVLQSAVQQALEDENSARLEGEPLTVAIERVGTRPAAKGNPGSPVLLHAMAAMQALGVTPELRISSTDANYPISIGVPAITISRGGIGENAHSPQESWQNVDGHVAIQIGLLTLLMEAGLP